MASPVLTVSSDSTLQEVAKFMRSHKTSVVLVKDKTHDHIGVVSNTDFTQKVAAKNGSTNKATIKSIMSSPIKTIEGSTNMAAANKTMLMSGVSHLIVTEKEEVAGLLSAINFFAYYQNVEKYLNDLAVIDGMTGIYNRRHFDESLAKEWKRTQREKISLSLIMLDIDYFKKYNDTYGHPAGDECLVKVAHCISEALRRPADMLARYGGEEFAIVLPNVTLEEAENLSEIIRSKIENMKIEHRLSNISPYITASLGIASNNPSPNSSPEELLQTADKALYNAKLKGRNTISIAYD